MKVDDWGRMRQFELRFVCSVAWRVALRVLPLVLVLLWGGAQQHAKAGEEQPQTLHGWLTAYGQDASFAARKTAFERDYPGEIYEGTLEQNLRWLRDLKAGARSTVPATGKPKRPAPDPAPHQIVVRQGAWRLTLDPRQARLHLDVPKIERTVWVQRGEPIKRTDYEDEPALLPDLSKHDWVHAAFLPAGVLVLKAKQFDDGLYAAVEYEAHSGRGHFVGKQQLLDGIVRGLSARGACSKGNAAAVLYAAKTMSMVRVFNAPACVAQRAQATRDAFLADDLRSKPMGFYTWWDHLGLIFRQDRLLQEKLEGAEGIHAVRAVLDGQPYLLKSYEAVLRLNARLTNALVGRDLRSVREGEAPKTNDPGLRFFPPSRSHEVDLAHRLWRGRPVPDGANLMNELIARIQSERILLSPRPDSGWYDHQTWALEPLLRPEKMPEAARLSYSTGYKRYLVDLFKGVLALTRETHVKQLELGAAGAMAQPPAFHVSPGLGLDPLPTHYRRRADGYRFVREVLRESFGPNALRTMHRLAKGRTISLDLDTELEFMIRLFDGAADVALQQIGTPVGVPEAVSEPRRFLFRIWAGQVALDPDVGQDARMMVPVFFDQGRRLTKVWAFLGWQKRPLTISYATPPRVVSVVGPEGRFEEKPEIKYHAQNVELLCPIMAEVYVGKLLDRDEFRTHCDKYKTRAAILQNLR